MEYREFKYRGRKYVVSESKAEITLDVARVCVNGCTVILLNSSTPERQKQLRLHCAITGRRMHRPTGAARRGGH